MKEKELQNTLPVMLAPVTSPGAEASTAPQTDVTPLEKAPTKKSDMLKPILTLKSLKAGDSNVTKNNSVVLS